MSGSPHVGAEQPERGFIQAGLAWSPDGLLLAIGSSTGVWIYNAETWEVYTHFSVENGVETLDWIPDGRFVASSIRKEGISVWDVATQQQVTFQSWDEKNLGVSVALWSPDGKSFALGDWSGYLRIWDAMTWERLFTLDVDTFEDDQRPINDIAWSPDGKQIIVCGSLPTSLWDPKTGELIRRLDNNRANFGIAWQPQSDVVAISVVDRLGGVIQVQDIATGEILLTLIGDDKAVRSLTFSPDGARLASVGDEFAPGDGLTRIWDVSTGEMLAEFQGGVFARLVNYTNAIAWSPDGSKLASTSDDGKVFVWDGNTFEPLGVYQLHEPLPI